MTEAILPGQPQATTTVALGAVARQEDHTADHREARTADRQVARTEVHQEVRMVDPQEALTVDHREVRTGVLVEICRPWPPSPCIPPVP
jgi:hypothetical protein